MGVKTHHRLRLTWCSGTFRAGEAAYSGNLPASGCPSTALAQSGQGIERGAIMQQTIERKATDKNAGQETVPTDPAHELTWERAVEMAIAGY